MNPKRLSAERLAEIQKKVKPHYDDDWDEDMAGLLAHIMWQDEQLKKAEAERNELKQLDHEYVEATGKKLERLREQLDLFENDTHPDYSVRPRIHHENDKAIYCSQVEQIVSLKQQLAEARNELGLLNDKYMDHLNLEAWTSDANRRLERELAAAQEQVRVLTKVKNIAQRLYECTCEMDEAQHCSEYFDALGDALAATAPKDPA